LNSNSIHFSADSTLFGSANLDEEKEEEVFHEEKEV
jgi:hypothetical protein